MKKIVAFVLALVMVLGMASFAFAAEEKTTVAVTKWVYTNFWDNNVATSANLKVTTNQAVDHIIFNEGTWFEEKVTIDTLVDKDFAVEGIKVVGSGPWSWGQITWQAYDAKDAKIEKAAGTITVPHVNPVILFAIQEAIAENNDTAVIKNVDVITEEDWAFILNNGWAIEAGIWKDHSYAKLNLKFVNGSTTYFIDAADLDYTWTDEVNLAETNGLDGYKKLTSSAVFTKIRELTGDRDPFVFGWEEEQDVPKMTISKVVDQSWLNNNGHKNLTLYAYNMETEVKCEVCEKVLDPKVELKEEAATEAAPKTQRVSIETEKLYKTLVLTAVAPAAEEAKTTDANPNTGANDIVNVAIVLSVISLVAAGAFVFSKQR